MVYKLYLRRPIVFILMVVVSLFSLTSYASEIRGQVADSHTGEPLAFVHVLIENSRRGTMTDIDGYFSIELQPNDSLLRLSYVGYYTELYRPKPEIPLQLITMQRGLWNWLKW